MLRIWDYFLVFGWKGIFKTSIALLREHEEQLLAMPFEVMLSQVVNLPTKWIFKQDSALTQGEEVERFDRAYRQVKVPTMLLERLKKEFELNYKLSGVISSQQQANR